MTATGRALPRAAGHRVSCRFLLGFDRDAGVVQAAEHRQPAVAARALLLRIDLGFAFAVVRREMFQSPSPALQTFLDLAPAVAGELYVPGARLPEEHARQRSLVRDRVKRQLRRLRA